MSTQRDNSQIARESLAQAKRLVVKIGSHVLIQSSGKLQGKRLSALVAELARLRHAGREVVLVTSGAIGAGMQALGIKRRPDHLPELQMAAAVGQSRLMTRYDKLFTRERCKIGQVLLTHDDLKQRTRHLNARNTMLTMLASGVIPIVNENDAVAVEEIKFGDNDLLAALVVHLIEAEALLILTTSDGLRQRSARVGQGSAAGASRRVKFLEAITPEVLKLADGKGSALSTGGMASKLEASRLASKNGAAVVIADGRKSGIIGKILAGADTGTLICSATAQGDATLPGRKRWIAYFHKPKGALIIDEGARRAIEHNGKSLLPIGVKQVEGEFEAGAAVDVKAMDQTLIARGLVSYSSRDLRLIQGQRTQALSSILGTANYEEVIHRDNLALLGVQGRILTGTMP